METGLVEIDRLAAGIALVRLNRPRAMNALSMALRQALVRVMAELEADPDCRVVILTGAGKAFCAGLDLRELAADTGGLASIGENDPVAAIGQFSGPVIAAVNGAAVTGGLEVVLACDIVVASENARFADTHAQVGVVPGWGLSQRLSRLVGLNRAKEMSLTGRFLGASEAEQWGLVNRIVKPDDLIATALAIGEMMLAAAPGMLPRYKRLIDDGYALPFGEALVEEQRRAESFNIMVDPGAIEGRREQVRSRGSGQVGQ